MTDKQIVKALECCKARNGLNNQCDKCPFHSLYCMDKLIVDTLDLINHQREEIENKDDLIHRQSDVISEQKEKIERIYVEAVKEFADLSIKRICENVTPIPQQKYLVNMCIQEIENTQKEVVG